MISTTPDGHPAIGETPEVAGLWSAAASWIKEGPGVGRAAAEWLSGGTPEIDIHEYLGEQFPVSVKVAGSTPLFDPANERIRC